MTVTDKLLHLHRIEQQIRGLRKRIDAAQKYLDEQDGLLSQIQARQDALAAQARQLQATAHNDEMEMGAIDAKIAKFREQLNAANTNKEYTAFLTEINTMKADRAAIEERALESMSRLEEVTSAVSEMEVKRTERMKIREVARAERDRRAQEVQDRLSELERERETAKKDVPKDAMIVLETQMRRHGDEAMAPIEEHNRRDLEYSCGSCQVLLPVELVSVLLGRGAMKQCVSCGAILYIDQTLREELTASVASKR